MTFASVPWSTWGRTDGGSSTAYDARPNAGGFMATIGWDITRPEAEPIEL